MARLNVRGIVTDTVFLARLVKGRLSLYRLVDEYDRLHFFIEKSGEIEELKIRKTLVTAPNPGVITSDVYRSQLAAATSDCPAGPPQTQRAMYSQSSLSKVILSYNKCFSDGGDEVRKTESVKVFLSAIAGVNYSGLTIYGGGYRAVNEKKFKPDIKPVFGIAFEGVAPRNLESWSVYADLIYRQYSMEDVFEATQLKLGLSLRYKIPVHHHVRPLFGLGVSSAYALKWKYPPPFIVADGEEFRRYEQGLFADAGAQGKRLGGWIRCELANGFSPFANTRTSFRLWYVTVSWRVNK